VWQPVDDDRTVPASGLPPSPLRPDGGARGAPDWGAGEASGGPGPAALAVACAPGVALALAAGLLLGPLAAGIALLVGSGASSAWVALQGRRALRSLRATPARKADAPRLVNLVEGLSQQVGAPAPSVWIADEGGRNALVCRSGGPCLVVTRRLLDEATRTELEAAVAHCLVRLRGGLLRESLGAAFGGPATALTVDAALDVRAVAVTRYPPGLAAAIAKADEPSRLRPFWLVAEGPSHAPRRARLEALADL
jgi:hypothetical protein